MKRRINNFHKSKPIVQNVKTDSVNEGKAPKNLTLANDISDWNPGVSHEQVSEASGDAPNSFVDAVAARSPQKGSGGGAAAPTSYSQAVNRFLIISGAQSRYLAAYKEWGQARDRIKSLSLELEELQNAQSELQDQYDSYNSEIAELTKMKQEATAKDDQAMVDKIDRKMNTVIDRNQEMVTKYNTAQSELDTVKNQVDAAEKATDAAESKGVKAEKTLKAYNGKIPEVDSDSKEPIKGEEPISEIPIRDVLNPDEPFQKPLPGNPIEIEPADGWAQRPIDYVQKRSDYSQTLDKETLDGELETPGNEFIAIDQSLKNAEAQNKEQSAALTTNDKELLPKEAKQVVSEFNPEDDMHEAVKAGGIGLDIIADGAAVERVITYFRFHKCGVPGVQYYTTTNLDKLGFPSDWETNLADGNQLYVTDGSSTNGPLIGEVDGTSILDLVDYNNGTYDGATGLTCIP